MLPPAEAEGSQRWIDYLYMSDVSSVPHPAIARFEEQQTWRTVLNWIAAILMSAVFLIAGIWKTSDPDRVAVMLSQLKVAQSLSVPMAIGLGIAETFTGILLLVPRFRRWGSLCASLLLLVFMLYIGVHYTELRGADCSCFPWLKRTVGPGFFIGDAIMLLLAMAAGVGTRAATGLKAASIVLGAVAVFALTSYAVSATRHKGTKAPESVLGEDGKPISLTEGKVFVYFFNPQCMHCLEAGRKLAALNWDSTRFVGVPTENPQFGDWFMDKAHLKGRGPVSKDVDVLRRIFPFDLPPAGVAIENGYEKAMLLQFEDAEPGATLRRLGFAH
jgi:uncharacterized membrane protein YphA (DoxX/SURF4 family)